MKDLLEDLELVLAQVARLQSQRPGEAITLINEALEERDVVPRIRSAVADLSGSDH
jgi:t-SNARE complex subunit (syntaxin)